MRQHNFDFRLNRKMGWSAYHRSVFARNIFFSWLLVLEKFGDFKTAALQRPHVLALIVGFGYREPIFKKVIEVAKLDRSINYTLLSGPNLNPEIFSDLPENVTIERFINDQFPSRLQNLQSS